METTYGSIEVDGRSYGDEDYQRDNEAERNLTVKADDGNIVISFRE